MKITEVNQDVVKVCPHSIRVLDDNGKTKGVVTQIVCLDKNVQPRLLFDLATAYRKRGLNLMDYYHTSVIIEGQLVYLHNLKKEKNLQHLIQLHSSRTPVDALEKSYLQKELSSLQQKYQTMQNLLQGCLKAGVPVVYCYYDSFPQSK